MPLASSLSPIAREFLNWPRRTCPWPSRRTNEASTLPIGRCSRALNSCNNTERQTAQTSVGALTQYRCLYKARLTYTATLDAVCNGKKAPAKVRAMVNYVKRGDRWLEAMYMQAP